MKTNQIFSYFLFLVSLLLMLLLKVPISNAMIDEPIIITENSGISRTQEPVTFGFPIKEAENLTSTTNLRVINDSGEVIPAQFRVLERWDTAVNENGKIKWILVDFQVSVSANSSKTYYIRNIGGNLASSPTLNIIENDNTYVINTGVAEWTINKNNFNLIDSANINGVPVISNSLGIDELKDGEHYLSTETSPLITEIEEQGDLRAVIHIEGYLSNNSVNSLRYVTRLHFYAGKPYIKIVHYYINDQNGINATLNDTTQVSSVDFTVSSLKDSFNLANPGTLFYSIGNTSGGEDFEGNVNNNVTAQQDSWSTYTGTIGSGNGKLPGWANIYDNNKGLVIIPRNFSEKFPHGISINDVGEISFDLLPEGLGENSGLHNFYIYQAHREEYLVYLHNSSRDINEVKNLYSGMMENPLFPHASPEYMTSSWGLGALSSYPSSEFSQFDTALDEAYENTINYQNTYCRGRFLYGAVWDHVNSLYASNFYDGIGVAIRQFARTGDLKWLKFGRNYAENFTSTGQFYCGEGTKDEHIWNAYSSGYGNDIHNRSGHNTIIANWIEGVIWYYKLTGDEYMFDRAKKYAESAVHRGLNYGRNCLSRECQEASIGAQRVWEITRDPILYNHWITHANYLVNTLNDNGVPYSSDGDYRHWMAVMGFSSFMYDVYIHTGNNEYKNAIITYANAMQPSSLGGCMVYENGNGYDYVERACEQTWVADNCARTGPRISTVNAYAYKLTGDQKYYNETYRQHKHNLAMITGADNTLGKIANQYHWSLEAIGIIEGSNQPTSIRADVNQDNQINTTDAMLTLRNSLGLDMSQTNWQISTTTGDVNCDGNSNSTDAMLILRKSLGLDMSGTGWCTS